MCCMFAQHTLSGSCTERVGYFEFVLCVKWRLSVPEEDEGEDGQVEDPEKLTGRRLCFGPSVSF